MRRRALLTVALLGCLSLLATGCAASEAPARDGNIPIGANIELTGPRRCWAPATRTRWTCSSATSTGRASWAAARSS
jgi:hypothetical protein